MSENVPDRETAISEITSFFNKGIDDDIKAEGRAALQALDNQGGAATNDLDNSPGCD